MTDLGGGERLAEVPEARLDLEQRLHDWALRDISVIEDDLLVIGTELETDVGGYVDILCLDRGGNLVVIELKRGRTPREVAAQVLDYGAWAHQLSGEAVEHLAQEYIGRDLGSVFWEQFEEELPEVLGESHRLLIVATQADARTERIVQYLSGVYGVDINVLLFTFFRTRDGRELLGRTFLLEPEGVEERSRGRSGSKRRPNLTREQLRAATERVGLAEAYDDLVSALSGPFRFDRTRSAAAFKARLDGGSRAIFNVVATESDPSRGLKFQIYTNRMAAWCGSPAEEVREALPPSVEEWAYFGEEPEWQGHEGYMQPADARRFVAWLGQQAESAL